MSKLTETVGMRLRIRRLELHLSQESVAEKANLHPTYIGQVERGEKNVTIDSLAKICEALDYPLEKLFEKIIEEIKEPSIPQKCYSLIAAQSIKNQEILLAIVESALLMKEK